MSSPYPVRSTIDKPQTCGGSSAGSGVSVSAGFVPCSIGTETGGSLVYPASKAGLYALRPTHGWVSSKGCFRISRSFDGIGGMAKTPGDLAVLIDAILTPAARKQIPEGGFATAMKGKAGLEGMRIGFVERQWGKSGDQPGEESRSDADRVVRIITPENLAYGRTNESRKRSMKMQSRS